MKLFRLLRSTFLRCLLRLFPPHGVIVEAIPSYLGLAYMTALSIIFIYASGSMKLFTPAFLMLFPHHRFIRFMVEAIPNCLAPPQLPFPFRFTSISSAHAFEAIPTCPLLPPNQSTNFSEVIHIFTSLPTFP